MYNIRKHFVYKRVIGNSKKPFSTKKKLFLAIFKKKKARGAHRVH